MCDVLVEFIFHFMIFLKAKTCFSKPLYYILGRRISSLGEFIRDVIYSLSFINLYKSDKFTQFGRAIFFKGITTTRKHRLRTGARNTTVLHYYYTTQKTHIPKKKIYIQKTYTW